MIKRLLVILTVLSAVVQAQSTQPAIDRKALERRANEEFDRGQYALALPVYRKLAELSMDKPDVLGPILERIRVCEKQLAPKERMGHPAPQAGQVVELTIKDLGNFDFDADRGGNIPEDVKKLSGHKLRLKGFMIPMDQAANITQFALVPDLFACCFGQPPQLQHTVVVNCPKGKAVSYFPDEITVEGTLTVEEKRDEGFIVSIFHVEVSSVKPSAK